MLCLELQDCPHTWSKEPVVFYHISALNTTSVHSLTKSTGSIFKQKRCLTSLKLPKVSVGQVRPEEPWRELEPGERLLLSFTPAQPAEGTPCPPSLAPGCPTEPSPPAGITLCQGAPHLPGIPQLPAGHEGLCSCFSRSLCWGQRRLANENHSKGACCK